MKLLSAIIIITTLSGCANTEWMTADERYGYKHWDPCIRCGEKIMMIPNSPFEAQVRRANGERW